MSGLAEPHLCCPVMPCDALPGCTCMCHTPPHTAAGYDSNAASCGSVRVAELDWAQPSSYEGLGQYDIVLAADCVYHEHLLAHLFRVLLAVTGDRSTGEELMAGFV